MYDHDQEKAKNHWKIHGTIPNNSTNEQVHISRNKYYFTDTSASLDTNKTRDLGQDMSHVEIILEPTRAKRGASDQRIFCKHNRVIFARMNTGSLFQRVSALQICLNFYLRIQFD